MLTFYQCIQSFVVYALKMDAYLNENVWIRIASDK